VNTRYHKASIEKTRTYGVSVKIHRYIGWVPIEHICVQNEQKESNNVEICIKKGSYIYISCRQVEECPE
jgi:hypothetical protein